MSEKNDKLANSSFADFLPEGVSQDDFFTVLAVGFALLVIAIVANSLIEKNPLGNRIKELAARREELKSGFVSSKRKHKDKAEQNVDFMRAVLMKMNLLKDANKTSPINDLLIQAGYRSKTAIVKYSFFQFVCPLVFLILSIPYTHVNLNDSSTWTHMFIPFGAVYCGAYLPKVLVVNQRDKRWHQIRRGLPDALDLMLICAEAGLTLSAALDRVSKEIGVAYPEVADELALTSVEIGFLPERKKAFENLVKRVNIPEIRAVVGILLQTEKYGTPVSQALKVLTREFRGQRMMRAEEKAARLPALMTVPMILFILPTLFIVVITPAIIRLFST